MKKTILFTLLCIGVCTFANAASSPVKKAIKKHSTTTKKTTFDCSVSLDCGGVTVTATGSTCSEAGGKAGAACDKILTIA